MTHEYWRNLVAKRLRSLGFEVVPDFPVGPRATVDLRAVKGERLIYLEIETGLSDIGANIEKCAALDGTIVFFFTLTKLAEKYRQSLGWMNAQVITPETIDRLESLR